MESKRSKTISRHLKREAAREHARDLNVGLVRCRGNPDKNVAGWLGRQHAPTWTAIFEVKKARLLHWRVVAVER